MEQQRVKLESVKQRLMNGEKVKTAGMKHGDFVVQLTNGPEITFDSNYRQTVENTIEKASRGVLESTEGNSELP